MNQIHILDLAMIHTPIQVSLLKSQGFKDKFESAIQGKSKYILGQWFKYGFEAKGKNMDQKTWADKKFHISFQSWKFQQQNSGEKQGSLPL